MTNNELYGTNVNDSFLHHVLDCFPKVITTKSNLPKDIEDVQLQRKVLVIDGDDYCLANKALTNEVVLRSKHIKESKNMLSSLLELLDQNLGQKYEISSKEMYGNKKPWKENKIEEMNTEGMIYVSYWTKVDDEHTVPLLFLSFMLTEEENLTHNDPVSSVIFLYEIQISKELRKQGLGQYFLSNCLFQCAKRLLDNDSLNLEFPFAGIELTVFADNLPAINLYQKLGMTHTPESPKDVLYDQNTRRRTRNSRKINNKNESPRILIKKPLYYMYWKPIL